MPNPILDDFNVIPLPQMPLGCFIIKDRREPACVAWHPSWKHPAKFGCLKEALDALVEEAEQAVLREVPQREGAGRDVPDVPRRGQENQLES